jgi:ABC-type branched-subunit amino acid transport system substrate-binding protein
VVSVAALPILTVGATAARAAAADPGITATTVTVGQVDTLSGPVPGLFAGAKYGTEAYLDYVNRGGGVDGRKILLDAQDDAFSAANYTVETQQLVKQSFALVGGFSLFDSSGVPAINAARIPDVTLSLSSARSLDQYNYSPNPLVVGGAALGPLRYLKEADGDAYQHVGTIYTNVSTAEVQSQAVFNAMKSLGYQITYSRVVTPFETNFLPDVLQMKATGVQMVYIVGMAVGGVAELAQQMAQQGFVPKVFTTSGVAYDSSYVTLAGSAANGTLTSEGSAMYLGQDAHAVPAVALFDKWFRRVNAHAPIDTYALYGWTSAELFVQALRAAGPDPTRATLLAQLDKITDFSADGLMAPGNPADKVPPTCWMLVKVVDGRWVRAAPSPRTGFRCHPGGYYYPPGYKKFVRAH